jgi:hypothetical protein
MGHDKYGFPAAALANASLVEQEYFGDNTKDLEQNWFEWLQYNPFDTAVGEKLAELYRKRLETMDPLEDASRVQQLQRKLDLIKHRIDRYSPENFNG